MLSKQSGSYISVFKKIEIIFHGFEVISSIKLQDGSNFKMEKLTIKMLDGLEFLKDYYDKSTYEILEELEEVRDQQVISIENSIGELILRW